MTSSPPPPHHHQINTTAVTDVNSASSNTTSTTAPWSCETNWTVSGGSLDSTVTFESFDFPIDSESAARKQPLLLVPHPSSDFQPCEIKLNFTQKHEIRQVYVKSTARVYEIYYAPALQSDNEYLCTVRCSAASVEDNFFPTPEEAVPVNLEGSNDILPKRRAAGENIIGANEDDWVEIKLPVGRVDEGNAYPSNKTSVNTRNYQNYYEATAEINDSEPCMSLTLRLLSLQSKGCVYVDEVYVFADIIDTNDPENHKGSAESSTGSSLMTMLVPTLLGLSKSRSLQLPDQHSSKSAGKPIETESRPAASTNPVNLSDQQDEKLIKQGDSKAESSPPGQVPAMSPDRDKVSDSTMRNDFSYNRAETLLEQLVSRVSRIEDICMRFEEKMLNPINSIEARLQHLEQQVELLAKKSEFSASPPCPKVEPNPRFIRNKENDSRLHCESESEEKGIRPTQIHQGLMAIDSELPNCDEKEEVDDVLEPSLENEKPKKSVSIDDALAAALAGFSSFTKANDGDAAVPIESPKEECLKHNENPIDTIVDEEKTEATNSEEFMKKSSMIDALDCAGNSSTASLDSSSDNNIQLQVTSEVGDEEATSPVSSSGSSSSKYENYKTDVQQDSIKEVKISDYDKAEILKHFPEQVDTSGEFKEGCESSIDFESPILDVKFSSLENGSLKTHLEALLSHTDDDPVTDGDVSVLPPSNVEENKANLLVELDCDDVGEAM